MNFKRHRYIVLLLGGLVGGLMTSPAWAKLNVFACEPEWASLAATLGGENVTTFSATTAFQDPHHIEARPSLIAKIRRADLLVCTGSELEIGWLPLLLQKSGNSAIQENKPGHFMAASQVERIEVPVSVDRSQGDVHGSGNPHVHWDPERLLTIAQALSERLKKIDAPNTSYYLQQMDEFTANWNIATERWQKIRDTLRGKQAIVYHKNWSYLLNWLQVDVIADLEPKPGLPPTSAHLATLLKTARATTPDFIIMANYQNDKGAQWLSKKTGVPVLRLPFTVGGNKQATDLLSLYDEVLAVMVGKETQ